MLKRLKHLLWLHTVKSWPLVVAVYQPMNEDGSPKKISVSFPGGERDYVPAPEFVPGPLSDNREYHWYPSPEDQKGPLGHV